MTRKPRGPTPTDKAKREFAAFLSDLLKDGQRPDGRHPQKPWTNVAFAKAVSDHGPACADNKVSTWIHAVRPSLPTDIEPLLTVLCGGNQPHLRNNILTLWQKANRTFPLDDTDAETAPSTEWDDRTEDTQLRGLELRLHRPQTLGNSDAIRVEATVWIGPGEYEHEDAAVAIGVREAYLSVEPGRYETAKGTLVSERDNPNFARADNAAKIVKPIDERGRLNGDPLGEDYLAFVEPKQTAQADEVTVILTSPRRSFDVTLLEATGQEVTHPNRDIVLNALIGTKLKTHPKSGRLVLARAKMRRTPPADA